MVAVFSASYVVYSLYTTYLIVHVLVPAGFSFALIFGSAKISTSNFRLSVLWLVNVSICFWNLDGGVIFLNSIKETLWLI